jgi:transcriptional regulator with XRE-family HTH domain
MHLKEYLEEKGLSYSAFAKQLGIHIQYIKSISCGIRSPGLKLALRIEELTEGKVTPREMIDNFNNPREGKRKARPKHVKDKHVNKDLD